MEKKYIPIGVSDFQEIMTCDAYYVDKSLFIKDVVKNRSTVLLFARPRRFGKTLNLSLLRYFYDIKEDNAELFANLKIAEHTKIMEQRGKHPVIYLTLKDVKQTTWKECYKQLKREITFLTSEFRYLLKSEFIDEEVKDSLQGILSKKAEIDDIANSLKTLSKALYQHHKVKPVILIDEYDTPIHQGYEDNFYKQIISFMRIFLGGALKDDKHLEKAVLTGILRVAKESLFSGLNNLEVCTMTDKTANDKFGFTDSEVVDLLNYYDNMFTLEDIRHWFDGYNYSGIEIYNPWSILMSLRKEALSQHWVNTAGNDLIKELCLQVDDDVKQEFDILTQRGLINKVIDNNIVFDDLGKDENAIWSFLLHTGYLRYDNLYIDKDDGTTKADLSIPNFELFYVFKNIIVKNWFTPPYNPKVLNKITQNLISGDLEVFKTEFQQYCLSAISYYDISGNNPEKLYHMFILGMLSCVIGIYQVKSNREAGLGRSDVMLIPIDRSKVTRGIIIEFKKVNKRKKETFEDKIAEAIEQINENKYAEELRSLGIKEIVNIIMAFAGKDVRVEIVHSA